MKAKTIKLTSKFPHSAEVIWEKLKHLSTLQYIASPYATFRTPNNTELTWKEKETTKVSLKLFGIFPLGTHTIKVLQFNHDTLAVLTNESNKTIPIWNHKITLEKINKNLTRYTDEIELYAGWKTPFVYWWGILFYKHRQKKWQKLLSGNTKKTTKQQVTVGCLMATYLAVLVAVILFKFPFVGPALKNLRGVELVPFFVTSIQNGTFYLVNIFVNILLFIPLGVFICLLKPNWKFAQKIIPIILLSLLFEILQYIFALGISDITDLITNTIGGILGIGCCLFMKPIPRK